MEKFIEKGFRIVNSHYPYTYTDRNHYISSEKMKTWTPYRTPLENTVCTDQILGGEGCAWDFGFYAEYSFLSYVVPPVLAILGDKLWDASVREHTEDYRQALSEYLFGSDEFTCIFDAVGEMIPPRKKDVFITPGVEMPTAEAVNACLTKLKAVNNPSCSVTAQKYIELFEKILTQIEQTSFER